MRLCQHCRAAISPLYRLTPREIAVLCELINGYSMRQAAQNLGIAYGTARSRWLNAARKLGIRTLFQLLTYKEHL